MSAITLQGRLKRLSATQANRGTKFVNLTLSTSQKLNAADESAFVELLSKHVTVAIQNGLPSTTQAELPLQAQPESKPEPQVILIPGQPIGKPRQTQRDRWLVGDKARPCVAQYRAWADRARKCAEDKMPAEIETVTIWAFFQMPDSWSVEKRLQMDGKRHEQKPDWDNLGKAVCDALLENDEGISEAHVYKRWTNGPGYIEVIFS